MAQCVHCGSTEDLSVCADCKAPLCAGHRDGRDVTKCYRCRGLSALNEAVALAILRAERLPTGSDESKAAYLEVAFAEEALSAFTSAQSVEGEICRRGAVMAALRAGNPSYAAGLARGYLNEDEDLSSDQRETLRLLFNAALSTENEH